MVCRGPTRVIHVIPGFQRPAQVLQSHADAPDVEKLQDNVDVAAAEEVSCPGLSTSQVEYFSPPEKNKEVKFNVCVWDQSRV